MAFSLKFYSGTSNEQQTYQMAFSLDSAKTVIGAISIKKFIIFFLLHASVFFHIFQNIYIFFLVDWKFLSFNILYFNSKVKANYILQILSKKLFSFAWRLEKRLNLFLKYFANGGHGEFAILASHFLSSSLMHWKKLKITFAKFREW